MKADRKSTPLYATWTLEDGDGLVGGNPEPHDEPMVTAGHLVEPQDRRWWGHVPGESWHVSVPSSFPEDRFTTKDSGERATFESGMQRDTNEGKARFDLLLPEGVPYADQMLTRWADLMGRGAAKYNDRNWEKASGEEELARFKESAARHFFQWLSGEVDEDHAAAVYFNIMGAEHVKARLGAHVPDVEDS